MQCWALSAVARFVRFVELLGNTLRVEFAPLRGLMAEDAAQRVRAAKC